MDRLEPQVRTYAWGSREAIARLTGREWPTAQPEAELWMGAHESAPSGLIEATGVRPLTEAIGADPVSLLGSSVADRFDGRLPFLLKVLAPVQALSIQTHPSARQALDAHAGTYADRWPKPEAFYALTDFHVFAGSQTFAETRATCRVLGVAELTGHVDAVESGPDPAYALLTRLLHLDPPDQTRLADAAVAACAEHPDDPALAAVVAVAEQHPSDIGLVVLLTMRHRVFRPGEYAYLPAGVLHAYAYGVAVEIMANSDNVVRAGLTQKGVDVDELLRIVDLDSPVREHPGEQVDGWTAFPADTDYFRLRSAPLSSDPLTLPDGGRPRVLLVLDGAAQVSDGTTTLRLDAGTCAFLSAADPQVTVRGDGRVFLASPGV